MICQWERCRFIASTLKELYDHSKSHDCTPPYQCKWENCQRICLKKARLHCHLLTHIPYRAYVCPACRKSFKREQEMKRHYISLHSSDQVQLHMISYTTEERNEQLTTNIMNIKSILN